MWCQVETQRTGALPILGPGRHAALSPQAPFLRVITAPALPGAPGWQGGEELVSLIGGEATRRQGGPITVVLSARWEMGPGFCVEGRGGGGYSPGD